MELPVGKMITPNQTKTQAERSKKQRRGRGSRTEVSARKEWSSHSVNTALEAGSRQAVRQSVSQSMFKCRGGGGTKAGEISSKYVSDLFRNIGGMKTRGGLETDLKGCNKQSFAKGILIREIGSAHWVGEM